VGVGVCFFPIIHVQAQLLPPAHHNALVP